MIPPIPMMGSAGNRFRTCQTIRSATGLIAGPESPPVTFPRHGRRFRQSTASPCSVLTSEIPSAPPFTAPSATFTMSVTFGVSFAKTGRFVAFRQSATTFSVLAGSVPRSIPCETFGHEILSSNASTRGSPSIRSTSRPNSSIVLPETLTTSAHG